MSTFSGLEIGTRALQANQRALDVTSQNLANAGTPGYSRQQAVMSTTSPYTYPSFGRGGSPGQVGTGVEVTAILRIRDGLIDQQIQQQNSILGESQSRENFLSQMETIMTEPSDSGIRQASDKFWASLEALANPDSAADEPTRSAVRQQAQTLTDQITQTYRQLDLLRSSANQQIKVQVDQVNSYADEIAQLNLQIGQLTSLGEHPNDLLDQRDQIVENLSKIVNITTNTDSMNRVNITINGQSLVADVKTAHIAAVVNTDDANMYQLQWEDTQSPVQVRSGNLKGLLDIRDRDLPAYMDNLDTYAKGLITEMNAIHRQGYGLDQSTGNDFFTGTGAGDIDISDAIKENLNKISASKTGAPGNGDIAREMANLKQEKIFNQKSATMGDFFSEVIAKLGVDSGAAQTKSDNQNLLINNLQNKRDSVSGVSYDEEMTNMLKYQHGYTAAAKIITTMNELLDVIVNGLKVS